MKRQPRVVWTKGMFLSPQHFQAQDSYFEDLVHSRFGASHFANYGVTQIGIDAEALSNGVFKLTAARGILPDGEAFDMPESDELPPSREVARHWPSSDETLDVYLSLPERRLNARNVTLPGQRDSSGPADTRYVSETRMMPDGNQGSDEKPVQVGLKSFRLLFGTEFRDGYGSIRLAQLERSPTGTPTLRAAFVPPCLDLAASDYLLNLLRRQVEILLTKSSSLSAPRRERGKAAAAFSASETDKFWLLHTVNSYLPELRHIFKTRRGHPEAAFVAMLRLAGALSTFSLEGGPGDLPDYDHDNLGPCFRALDAHIRDLMEIVIPSKYVSIPLTLTDRFVWSGSVQDDTLFKTGQFYLAVSAKMGVGDLIQKVPIYLKMAAPDDMERVVRNALAGVNLIHSQVVPPAIPMKLDNQYFQINRTGPLWERIVMSRRISVFAPSEIVEPKMEVVVVWE
ncbi:MAG TPA: type VI secretion system baseplate subunit TssK [Bryobacteraceae bacterium]|jgi:type VI secretion system protein ImpJ